MNLSNLKISYTFKENLIQFNHPSKVVYIIMNLSLSVWNIYGNWTSGNYIDSMLWLLLFQHWHCWRYFRQRNIESIELIDSYPVKVKLFSKLKTLHYSSDSFPLNKIKIVTDKHHKIRRNPVIVTYKVLLFITFCRYLFYFFSCIAKKKKILAFG